MKERKILILTYNFPPINSPAVYRILGFLRYLQGYNFSSFVLTTKNPFGDAYDESLLEKVPKETKIFRSYSFEKDRLCEKIKKVILIKKRDFVNENNTMVEVATPKKKLLQCAKALFIEYFKQWELLIFNLPDSKVGWVPFALLKGINIVKREKIDIILASSPPHSLQLIGVFLKKISGKKLIVDLRDYFKQDFAGKSVVYAKCYTLIQKAILGNADLIIANTPGMRREIIKKYSFLESKVFTINNGFDRPNHSSLLNTERELSVSKTLEVVFIGTVYENMLDCLLPVIFELNSEIKGLHDMLKINIIGTISPESLKEIFNLKLDDIIVYKGFVKHKEITNYVDKASVLLILLPDDNVSSYCIPSKVYEYLISNKYILGIAPDGDLKDLIESTKTGICVHPKNRKKIKETILELIAQHNTGKLRVNPDEYAIEQYDRKRLVSKFAQLVNEKIKI